METWEKLDELKKRLKELGSITVAFSGGVDSTFLLKVAFDVLGNQVLAVTAHASIYPAHEHKEALEFTRSLGVKQIIAEFDEENIEGFIENPPNRCYLCKSEVFKKVIEISKKHDIVHVADGSNLDDDRDYRPGVKALRELGVLSPLREVGLSKSEIRSLSKQMELPSWDKPAIACLASRIPYHHTITKEKLRMVDHAEQYLRALGFRQVRVRHHGEIARIEVPIEERKRFFDELVMDQVHERLIQEGFLYVALDLKGYRMGSLNTGLPV